jgi:hypothetical protein
MPLQHPRDCSNAGKWIHDSFDALISWRKWGSCTCMERLWWEDVILILRCNHRAVSALSPAPLGVLKSNVKFQQNNQRIPVECLQWMSALLCVMSEQIQHNMCKNCNYSSEWRTYDSEIYRTHSISLEARRGSGYNQSSSVMDTVVISTASNLLHPLIDRPMME